MYEIDWLMTCGYFIASSVFMMIGVLAKFVLMVVLKQWWYLEKNEFKFCLFELLPLLAVGYAACYFIINK